MKNSSIILPLAILLLGFSACKKDKLEPPGIIPSIELVSVNKSSIQEFTDSLVFTISYVDGDGDLGIANPDSTVIELIDNRDSVNLVFGYHLSPRSPQGTTIAVQGQLQVVLKNIAILSSSATSETTTFSIRMKDRAQNWSNKVISPNVTINR